MTRGAMRPTEHDAVWPDPSSRRRDLLRANGVLSPELTMPPLLFRRCRGFGCEEVSAVYQHPMQDDRQLAPNATFALRIPARIASRIAQLFSDDPFTGLVRMTFAAS